VLDRRIAVHDGVQADHRARHPHQRGLQQTVFTIMDFKQAIALFADPAFDGDPVQILRARPGPPASPAR